ncbi:MAG: sugar ABC transporter ATP-binding protein [Spirochaetaceae bacterium]|nr:MAG: sugar ABC transporter ATP-binding protein [Spirochaetaceae bacterium]
MNYLLEFNNITKEYPGVVALKDINFGIKKNEIHGIVGENGAGKSTLLKIIAGDISDYSGDLIFEGNKVTFKSPHDAINTGIGVVYQELNLCANLNATQNLFLGREIKKGIRVDWTRMAEMTADYLRSLNLEIEIKVPVRFYNTAQQQIIEIAKATIFNSKIVIMDEPTSALNQVEVKRLFELLRDLQSKGVTIVFVSHRINEVLDISDRISVLRNGKYINTFDASITNQNQIVQSMIGQHILFSEQKTAGTLEREEALRVTNLAKKDKYTNINFTLNRGEILGVAGLEGSGRFQLGRALYGMVPYDQGKIHIFKKEVKIKKPRDAINNGIGFISRDRKVEGIFSLLDLIKNVTMVVTLDEKIVNSTKNTELTRRFIDKLRIVCSSIKQNISSLSGGNQQKSIVARWLVKNPRIIIMEEPTHGIDVGAKVEMFEIIRQLSKSGTSIIIISSEIGELIHECDRILIMKSGEIKGEVTSSKTNEHEIMSIATGIANN